MKVSVVIPCYNAERWVGDALHSVASQTYPPHEIIVVDDGSSDGSVRSIAQSGVEVLLLHTYRANGAGARNAGIRVATGDWIAFQDADDLWYSDHLERAVRLLETSDDVAYWAWSDFFYDGDDESMLRAPVPWPELDTPISGLPGRRYVDLLARSPGFTMPSAVVRRDVLVERGMLDEQMRRRHDIEMWLRVLARNTWSFDPVPSTAFRVDSAGSISRSVASAAWYFLRAMVRHATTYDGAAMRRVLTRAARSALATAYTDGSRAEQVAAWELSWPYLTRRDRAVFAAAAPWPRAFGWVNRMRRRRKRASHAGPERVARR